MYAYRPLLSGIRYLNSPSTLNAPPAPAWPARTDARAVLDALELLATRGPSLIVEWETGCLLSGRPVGAMPTVRMHGLSRVADPLGCPAPGAGRPMTHIDRLSHGASVVTQGIMGQAVIRRSHTFLQYKALERILMGGFPLQPGS